jgi:heme exporter protein B
VSGLRRIWAVASKDAAEESRRRIAAGSIFFFAATSLALCSFAVGPFGVPPEARPQVSAALLWILLFFSAATGLPRAFVREEETGTGLALRRSAAAPIVLAGKALFNYLLFLAIAAVTVPVFALLMEWRPAAPGAGGHLDVSLGAGGAGRAAERPLRRNLLPAGDAPAAGRDRRDARVLSRRGPVGTTARARRLRRRGGLRRVPARRGGMGRLRMSRRSTID